VAWAGSRRASSRRSWRCSARSRSSSASFCSSSGGRPAGSRRGAGMPRCETLAVGLAAVVLVVVLPVCTALPAGAPFAVSNFTLNLFGKFLTYAILALGLDLLWGYAGVLSLGHGVFFGLGAYAMGMHLMLEIGAKSVYQSALPDFMVWNQVTALPLFCPSTQRGLYVVTALTLVAAYLLCRWITLTRAGKVLVAIRDSETRVLFSGYSPAAYKLFVFVVSAVLAGLAGALYAPQVGIITPAKIGVLPSIEMVVWVAAGGRGTLYGSVIGAFGVNWIQSRLNTHYPDLWLLFLGGLFMGEVLCCSDGLLGAR